MMPARLWIRYILSNPPKIRSTHRARVAMRRLKPKTVITHDDITSPRTLCVADSPGFRAMGPSKMARSTAQITRWTPTMMGK